MAYGRKTAVLGSRRRATGVEAARMTGRWMWSVPNRHEGASLSQKLEHDHAEGNQTTCISTKFDAFMYPSYSRDLNRNVVLSKTIIYPSEARGHHIVIRDVARSRPYTNNQKQIPATLMPPSEQPVAMIPCYTTEGTRATSRVRTLSR